MKFIKLEGINVEQLFISNLDEDGSFLTILLRLKKDYDVDESSCRQVYIERAFKDSLSAQAYQKNTDREYRYAEDYVSNPFMPMCFGIFLKQTENIFVQIGTE